MNEIIEQVQNDSTLMLIVAVSLAMFLIIFLVIVVSAMRIKYFKVNFRRIQVENANISEENLLLEKELKVYKITDQKNKKELAKDAHTIEQLTKDTIDYPALRVSASRTDKVLGQTKEELKVSYLKYEALQLELEALQKRHSTLTDDHTKCRTNNARLLMKLESAKGKQP